MASLRRDQAAGSPAEQVDPLQSPSGAAATATAEAPPAPASRCGMGDALCDAAARGDIIRLHELLSAGASANSRAADGATALVMAAWHNEYDALQLLLQSGADTEAYFGGTALFHAVIGGHTHCVCALLAAGACADAPCRGYTPLMHAAMGGRAGLVRLLLRFGAQLEPRDGNGSTAALWAAQRGKADCLRALLEAGADATAAAADGTSGLHAAARNSDPECVALLLRFGANTEARDGEQRTPLHVAADPRDAGKEEGALECIRLLHQAGADPSARNKWGRTPRYCAETCKNLRSAALLAQLELQTGGLQARLCGSRCPLVVHLGRPRGASPLGSACREHPDRSPRLAAQHLPN